MHLNPYTKANVLSKKRVKELVSNTGSRLLDRLIGLSKMRSADFVEDVKDSNQKQERQFIVKNEKSKTKETGCITRSRIQ